MSRQRRENVDGGRRHRHEVKVTPEEDTVIALAARDQGVGWVRFVVESAVAVARAGNDGTGPETATVRRNRITELFALRHVIAEAALGAWRAEVNINQIAKRVNQGQPLPIEELRSNLRESQEFRRRAREVAEHIDDLIDEIASLGVRT